MIIEDYSLRGESLSIKANDSSMEKARIYEGDYVLVDTMGILENECIVAVQLPNEDGIAFRKYRHTDGKITLIPMSRDTSLQDQTYGEDEIRIIGRAYRVLNNLTDTGSMEDQEEETPEGCLKLMQLLREVGEDFRHTGEDQDPEEEDLDYEEIRIWVRSNLQHSGEVADTMAAYLLDCYLEGREARSSDDLRDGREEEAAAQATTWIISQLQPILSSMDDRKQKILLAFAKGLV